MANILIAEDEKPIRELIRRSLTLAGHTVRQAEDGPAALQMIGQETPDLVLLDVMLPGADGFALLEYIEPTGTPVIFLTARGSVEDRVRGLRAGAYDYIVKPFAASELVARVEGVLRHTGRYGGLLRLWDITIDPATRTVRKGPEPVGLTPREYELLLALARSRGIALYREVLFERVWGLDSDAGPRTLDIHISRLRHKLGLGGRLQAVPKVGYLLQKEGDRCDFLPG